MSNILHKLNEYKEGLDKEFLKLYEDFYNYSYDFENTNSNKLFNSNQNSYENNLHEACCYAFLNGGKRLRPYLLANSANLFGIDYKRSYIPAIALEAIHSYSLVHDDLPAMDDDDLRRGNPTIHKKYNEATAILVGDALQSFAFELVSDTSFQLEAKTKLQLANSLAKAAGLNGMVIGQALDLSFEKLDDLSHDDISLMQGYKTGALIEFACYTGAIMANRPQNDIEKLKLFGKNIGLAFQISDDILDVCSTEQKLGKKTQKDRDKGKKSLIDFYGIDGAKLKAKEIIDDAKKLISGYDNNENLIEIADYIINRDY